MEGKIGWLFLISLGLIVGAVLGWVAFFRVIRLRDQVTKLQRELATVKDGFSQTEPQITFPVTPEPLDTEQETEAPARSFHEEGGEEETESPEWGAAPEGKPRWLSALVDNWMIWLGAVSVALAGVFMVKYSIEIGLLGPKARITAAILTGLGLHGAAEWLRRRTGGSDPVFAALAGGASVTLYAALLAALHLYHLLDPRLVFVLLTIVSLMTMVLSLVHGPVLAIIGLIGAYVVPILVSTDSGNMVVAMTYSLIISGAALLLLRYVFRYWLWWGIAAGGLGWWLLSLDAPQADSFRGIYLALLALGVVVLPTLDWLSRGIEVSSPDKLEPGAKPILFFGCHWFGQYWQLSQVTIFLIILAWGFSIYHQGFSSGALVLWAPLVVVVCLAARHRTSLAALPWISLAVQWIAWFLSTVSFDSHFDHFELSSLPFGLESQFLSFAAFMALTYTVLALFHLRQRGFSHSWVSLAALAPLAWLALLYLLVNGLSQSTHWSMLTLMTGVAYGALAGYLLQRGLRHDAVLWFTLGAHIAYSLAVTMYFREASLTLALSVQLLSLSWIVKRHQLPWLDNVIKLLLMVVVFRLTFNPWLLGYPDDIHWSLWTYGGATLFCALASLQSRSSPALHKWLEAATLHLLVLAIGAEVRCWLYDGEIFVQRYSLTEAAINTSLWSGLALTYYYRSLISESLESLYQLCSRILLALSLGSYCIAALIKNPLLDYVEISTTPVFNILLLAYGLPVIMALLVARYHELRFRRLALGIAGLGFLLFMSLEIRHLWQGGELSLNRVTGDGELYTYSIVWLLMAIAAILLSANLQVRDLYKGGMGLLAVVIAKIFMMDMSGLEGLLRVASFMGLGLSLLGLAWLHRRIYNNGTATENHQS